MTLSFSHFYSLENSQARYEQAIQMIFDELAPNHCLIGQFINGRTQVQTVCYAKDGVLQPNTTYDLAGTPCNDAQESSGVCMLNQCLQETYVDDELLRVLNINSYAGVTLRALDHTPIGIMVCMYEDERLLTDSQQSFLKELSYIVGAELNHNLEMASQDLILKQLAKGERIAKLSSWNWHIGQERHWFSKEMRNLIGKHHDIELSLDCFLECLELRDKERLEDLLSQLKHGAIEHIDTTVRHKLFSKRKGLMRIIGHVENETGPISERVFTATVQDISQINALTKQLELTNVVFEHATDAIMITDHENKIIMVNKAFEDLTGYKGYELMGQDPGVLSSGQQSKQFYKKMWHALETSGTWKGEIYNRRKNGQIFPEELTLSVVKDELNQPTNYVAIFRDITEWKRNEAQLTFYANHEPLTGLTNRRSFLENLEQVISENRAKKKRVCCFIYWLRQI
ncbi:PAS domain S-box protein [Pseudoalteromonas phenolica]|uniref:PAS domain S-box protein n=1 Tax=Pseudoalteromonas phenolica TaxID=161398 RepID=UPI001F4F8F7D|nr:PAS domain S-box protein [Pseudoalteromonas phenolica]